MNSIQPFEKDQPWASDMLFKTQPDLVFSLNGKHWASLENRFWRIRRRPLLVVGCLLLAMSLVLVFSIVLWGAAFALLCVLALLMALGNGRYWARAMGWVTDQRMTTGPHRIWIGEQGMRLAGRDMVIAARWSDVSAPIDLEDISVLAFRNGFRFPIPKDSEGAGPLVDSVHRRAQTAQFKDQSIWHTS